MPCGRAKSHGCGASDGTSPATLSIDAAAATTVLLYGECVANLAKGANVTTAGSALTVNSSLT